MPAQRDINFAHITPRQGSKTAAFEELCCQLAARKLPPGAGYNRLDGAGGDGGVECFADLPDGSRMAWQAKYVFNIDGLLRQATRSLTTALQIHDTLTRYVLCFPFDLTGPTNRTGRSGTEKFTDWRQEQLNRAQGRELEIDIWSATNLRTLLLDLDPSGGMRSYFFDTLAFSDDWFKAHLEEAKTKAGPRYTPEFNVRTGVAEWFAAFGRTPDWLDEFSKRADEATKDFGDFRSRVEKASTDPVFPSWPEEFKENALSICGQLDEAGRMSTALVRDETRASHNGTLGLLHKALAGLTEMDRDMSAALEAKHGAGTADSPGFRQVMSEYHMTFPAQNLDELRKVRQSVQGLLDWLESPEAYLGFRKAFVLSGGWGVGKTHTACDVADRRQEHGLRTCIVFGHEFDGEPDPWTRLAETLGLPGTLGREKLLGSLNCAAEASGHPLLIVVDAVNETSPRRYWNNRILPLVKEIEKNPHLRICIACRTPLIRQCLPDGHGLDVIEHPGFKGIEGIACQAFFEHHKLQPPFTPFLQPELSNPLYLKIVCETLAGRGEDTLPSGWSSMARVVEAFLHQKDHDFAKEKGISPGARLITRSLHELALALAESVQSSIRWSRAGEVVDRVDPRANTLGIVEWLKGEELLTEGAPERGAEYGSENTLRLAFERLGDFLLARRLLDGAAGEPLSDAFRAGGRLHPLIRNGAQVDENHGVLSALSILIPEVDAGIELPQLVGPGAIRDSLLEITLASLFGRDPSTFSEATRRLIREGLARPRLSEMSMDSVLAVAWQPSAVDAGWLHQLLVAQPLAKRDAFWCGYLHQAYEASGPTWRLIHAAFDLPIEELDVTVAEQWATILTWFTAAADRRVRDWATRALLRVLTEHPCLIPTLSRLFLVLDDDAVRQRFLLASYGALLASKDRYVIAEVTEAAYQAFATDPESFDNAVTRDQIRLLAELARRVDALPKKRDPEFTMEGISSEWPLEIPSEDQVEAWSNVIHFTPNEFASDFFKYSMNCLRPWQESFSKDDMGKWILQRVARDFGYEGSGCEDYDRYMLGKFGGGRGKPEWAERIGKKYQWMAMYQLASRLNDHVERKDDPWEPSPMRTPLILLEERKLDPTLPRTVFDGESRNTPWWIGSSVEFGSSDSLSHEQWIAKEEDLPSLESMVALAENSGQVWRPLVLYVSWSEDRTMKEKREPYRQVRLQIEGYLVPAEDLSSAYDSLFRNNVSDRKTPTPAEWHYGFPGEYPWATPFNTEPDEWYGSGGTDVSVSYEACWNRIGVEWEYDATLTRNLNIVVPAKRFFSRGDLWWDRRDGYGMVDGRTVFRDPSLTEGGPASLLADAHDLPRRLESIGRRLIWTMLGEKIILGGSLRQSFPRRLFSEVALMRSDGSVDASDRVFIEN